MAITQELSRLYREYYANRLSLADYRYQRGLLLDSLVAAAVPLEVESDEDITISRGELQEQIAADPEPDARTEPRRTRWPLIATVFVALAGGGVYVVSTQLDQPGNTVPLPAESETPPRVAAPETDELAEPDVYIEPDVGQPLVEAFLNADDWSEASLRRFLDAWVNLPAQDRIVAKGATWFEPLADRLEYEIVEAEEFSTAPDADVKLQQLYATALGLGLTELAPDNWKPGLATRSVPQQEAATGRASESPPAEEESPVEASVETPDAEVDIPMVAESDEDDSLADVEETVVHTEPLENEDACRAEQLETRRRSCFDLLASGGQGPAMRVIPAGTVADVAVDSPFAISTTEVSRNEFVAFCEATGTECPADPWPGENMPVVNVSRLDATAYCDWLSAETGYSYRLPTDAEWEYAARAGVTTDYPFGDEITAGLARYSSITSYESPLPREDRTTQRNEFGLWHVIGNVREWVDSSATDGYGVTRGGSYADDADGLKISLRQTMPENERDAMTGFRVVREL